MDLNKIKNFSIFFFKRKFVPSIFSQKQNIFVRKQPSWKIIYSWSLEKFTYIHTIAILFAVYTFHTHHINFSWRRFHPHPFSIFFGCTSFPCSSGDKKGEITKKTFSTLLKSLIREGKFGRICAVVGYHTLPFYSKCLQVWKTFLNISD